MNDKIYLVLDIDEEAILEIYANEVDAEERRIEIFEEEGEGLYGDYRVEEKYLIGKLEGDVIYVVVNEYSDRFSNGEIMGFFGSKEDAEKYMQNEGLVGCDYFYISTMELK